ncbi:uncharacterized protein LOC143444215 isoform X2 [Clavelina lepadiformis]|uniref:uncharacterized protein LOC143444215 isoform X2 n=1 Tax=Clavelina lepadiformis TaxID=159417 RepID=UPI004042BD9F
MGVEIENKTILKTLLVVIFNSQVAVARDCSFMDEVQTLDVFEGTAVELECSCENRVETFSSNTDITVDFNSLDISFWSTQRTPNEKRNWVIAFGINKQFVMDVFNKRDIVTFSGNSHHATCFFPFTYSDEGQNETHYSCGSAGAQSAICWCATTQNFAVDRKWGLCPCAFPTPGVRLLAEDGTAPGDFCHFPFKYAGIEFYSCTVYFKIRCWCGTTYDVDKDNRWGYCPCAKVPLYGQWGKWGKWSSCRCGELTFRSRACTSKAKNIPTGVSVVCESGYAVQVSKCSCLNERLNSETVRIVNVMTRAAVIPPGGRGRTSKLVINSTKSSDSGLYTCNRAKLIGKAKSKSNSVIQKRVAAYYLNVVTLENFQTVFKDNGENLNLDSAIPKWHWTEWQDCDRCGIFTGEQRKCDRKRVVGRKYKNYIVVRKCKARCPVQPEFELVHANAEKPPSLPKLAERKLINAVLGEAIRLPCPGASAMLPVSWQFEGSTPGSPLQPLLRHEINIEGASVYATFIDIANDLYLESVSLANDGYYSCFVNRSLSASYRAALYSVRFVFALIALLYGNQIWMQRNVRRDDRLFPEECFLLLPIFYKYIYTVYRSQYFKV